MSIAPSSVDSKQSSHLPRTTAEPHSERVPSRAELAQFFALASYLLGVPILMRWAAVYAMKVTVGFFDLRGLLADIGVSLLFLLATWTAGKQGRFLGAILVDIWTVLYGLNFLHVRALNSSLSLTYAGYIFDPVFLHGSALPRYWPWAVLFFVVLPYLAQRFWPSNYGWTIRARVISLALGLSFVAGACSIPPSPAELQWRQQNVILASFSALASTAPNTKRPNGVSKDVPQGLKPDLAGYPLAMRTVNNPNILLVLVESLSGAYLPTIAQHHQVQSPVAMPNLDRIAKNALTFATAFSHQRQTNRGEYSILCGDYPKLRSETARMTEIALGRAKRRCLPSILKNEGYRTAYLQAAPMAFMMKDKFMKRIGFTELHGAEYFENAKARNAWGVDDLTFFEQASHFVEKLQEKGSPWFLTLLTVGTHHPYLLPADCQRPGSEFSQAVHCADVGIQRFMDQLQSRGALKNTVVIITSDESAGIPSGPNLLLQLSQNWVPIVIIAPDQPQARLIDTPVSHSEIALSVVDYLGRTELARGLLGRSLFREYATPRSTYFANTYLNRVGSLEPQRDGSGRLALCDEQLLACQNFEVALNHPFTVPRATTTSDDSARNAMQGVVNYASRELKQQAPPNLELKLIESGVVELRPSTDGQLLIGGQYLSVRKDINITLELSMTVSDTNGVALKPWLSLQGINHDIYKPNLPWLSSGDELRIQKKFKAPHDIEKFEAVMSVRTHGANGASIRFNQAVLRLRSDAEDSEQSPESDVVVSRTRNHAPIRYETGKDNPFAFASCVNGRNHGGHFTGNCSESFLMSGPYAFAPSGTTLHSSVLVRVNHGTQTFWLEQVANEGSQLLSRSKNVTLRSGQELRLETEHEAQGDLNLIETRLRSPEGTQSSNIEIWDGQMELVN